MAKLYIAYPVAAENLQENKRNAGDLVESSLPSVKERQFVLHGGRFAKSLFSDGSWPRIRLQMIDSYILSCGANDKALPKSAATMETNTMANTRFRCRSVSGVTPAEASLSAESRGVVSVSAIVKGERNLSGSCSKRLGKFRVT